MLSQVLGPASRPYNFQTTKHRTKKKHCTPKDEKLTKLSLDRPQLLIWFGWASGWLAGRLMHLVTTFLENQQHQQQKKETYYTTRHAGNSSFYNRVSLISFGFFRLLFVHSCWPAGLPLLVVAADNFRKLGSFESAPWQIQMRILLHTKRTQTRRIVNNATLGA